MVTNKASKQRSNALPPKQDTSPYSKSVDPKNKASMLSNDAKESDGEYDNDDFEKDDLVQMAEPKPQQKQAEHKQRKQAAIINLAER
jgi:hypothetical protein